MTCLTKCVECLRRENEKVLPCDRGWPIFPHAMPTGPCLPKYLATITHDTCPRFVCVGFSLQQDCSLHASLSKKEWCSRASTSTVIISNISAAGSIHQCKWMCDLTWAGSAALRGRWVGARDATCQQHVLMWMSQLILRMLGCMQCERLDV